MAVYCPSMKNVLITGDGVFPSYFIAFEHANLRLLHRPIVSQAELRSLLPEINAYILGGEERLDRHLLGLGRSLELISFVGTGVGTFIDEQAAADLGITVTRTPGLMATTVAEHTLSMLLALTRQLLSNNNRSKSASTIVHPRDLSDLQIGVIGMGATATELARILASGFNVSVSYYSRTRKLEVEALYKSKYLCLSELLKEMDIIVLLIPLSPDTRDFLNIRMFDKMKDGVILINTASAGLVNPHDLKRALDSGKVSATAFDGYWQEPIPSVDFDPYGLLETDESKFLLTPHIAAKGGVWNRMMDAAVTNVLTFYGAHGANVEE